MNVSDLKKNFIRPDGQEGPLAQAIEDRTRKLSSDTFLWLALGSIGAALGLQLSGKKSASNFVGQWAPTLLLFGLYNKLVKVAGSSRAEREVFPEENTLSGPLNQESKSRDKEPLSANA